MTSEDSKTKKLRTRDSHGTVPPPSGTRFPVSSDAHLVVTPDELWALHRTRLIPATPDQEALRLCESRTLSKGPTGGDKTGEQTPSPDFLSLRRGPIEHDPGWDRGPGTTGLVLVRVLTGFSLEPLRGRVVAPREKESFVSFCFVFSFEFSEDPF